jgi:hypothetical protein
MGYYIHILVLHLIEPIRNDFVEMLLHHLITIFLYSFTHMTHLSPGGAVVCLLHNWSDIFTAITKVFTETTVTSMSLIGAIGMVITWAYTRLYVFPYVIYYTSLERDVFEGHATFGFRFYGVTLICLYILHWYWFGLILKAFFRFFTAGKTDDVQSEIKAPTQTLDAKKHQ